MKRTLSKTYVDNAEYPGLPLDALRIDLRDGKIADEEFERQKTELLESCQYVDENGWVQWGPCLIWDTHPDAPRGLAYVSPLPVSRRSLRTTA